MANVAPVWTANLGSRYAIISADYAGTIYDPKLVITHDAVAEGANAPFYGMNF